ncbi:MAG: AAA family ATPase [Leptolyngbyaceae cyanobacterium bins.302]|nr:AAA family ATPase [Leptolyngbyaceae cyanobacterium bins.302]
MDEAFPDNWTYLRTELNWLDRVLAGAIARQRKDTKEVDRVSKVRADQVTSHWWKGLIQVDGTIAGDSPVEAPRRSTQIPYQQRIETRIAASHQRGIVLGLPSLCQQLELSNFEKNLLLMALAPEISRRYGRIYNFLQETDYPGASGLPTIDLILRLLCRNDSEWRSARRSLSSHAKLLQYGIVVLPESATEPFLSHPVKLVEQMTDYLLAEEPQLTNLDRLLQPKQPAVEAFDLHNMPDTWKPKPVKTLEIQAIAAIAEFPPPTEDLWAKLLLPQGLQAALHHLSDRVQYTAQVDGDWGFKPHNLPEAIACGTVALFVGGSGAGKTLAARAIAQSLNVPLVQVDLTLLEPRQTDQVLHQLTTQSPPVLLLKSVEQWFGRSAVITPAKLHQFLQKRQHSHSITLLSVKSGHLIKASWQSSFNFILKFPLPNKANRLQLWKQAFPAATPLAEDIDWQELSRWKLSGGSIQAIAREAAIFAAARSPLEHAETNGKLEMRHILQAYKTLNRTSI